MTFTAQTEAYRTLPDVFYAEAAPAPVPRANVFAFNRDLSAFLGLPEGWEASPEGLSVLSGQTTLSADPSIALAYSGHQFGHWAGTLGDGRARLAGEVKAQDGVLRELHLKGAGQTPYSRRGDGKATLGSAIREYIVSEAMAALGIPTMRSLSIVTTGEIIQRQAREPAAILCRSGFSHLRVGTFQYAAALEEPDHIKALADFTIQRLYADEVKGHDNPYAAFFRGVVRRQAELVAKWMSVGFIHGVMNTDNMCISGETIDYGPCAFMDEFHPAKVFSSIDRRGRYAWNKQPEMANWNLARLAESLLPLFGGDEDAQVKTAEAELGAFAGIFQQEFNNIFANKFGVARIAPGLSAFIGDSFQAMGRGQVDFTQFFTALTVMAAGGQEEPLLSQFSEGGADWIGKWKEISEYDGGVGAPRLAAMRASNPVIIPRNHKVEETIAAAYLGDFEPFRQFVAVISAPYESRLAFADYEKAPEPEEIVKQTFCGT